MRAWLGLRRVLSLVPRHYDSSHCVYSFHPSYIHGASKIRRAQPSRVCPLGGAVRALLILLLSVDVVLSVHGIHTSDCRFLPLMAPKDGGPL